jgi:Rad3-related DNA helicase
MSALSDMVAYAFSPDGPAKMVLSQYRPQQGQFALGLAAFLERADPTAQPVFMQEVFAGLGKTVAVLVVLGLDRLLNRRRSRISTFKRSLRADYLEAADSANAIIQQTLRGQPYQPITVADYKSISSYLSPSKMDHLAERIAAHLEDDPMTIEFHQAYRDLLEAGEDPDFAQVTEIAPLPDNTSEVHWAFCREDRNSDLYRRIMADRQTGIEADILVITHAMLIRNILTNGAMGESEELPRFGLVLVDEADKFPTVAYNSLSVSLNVSDMSAIITDGLDSLITKPEAVKQAEVDITNSLDLLMSWHDTIQRTIVLDAHSERGIEIKTHLVLISNGLAKIERALSAQGNPDILVIDEITRLRQQLAILSKGADYDRAVVGMRMFRGLQVQSDLQLSVNFSSGKTLTTRLWRENDHLLGIAFVSATLADRPPFENEYTRFKSALGFDSKLDHAIELPPLQRHHFGRIEEVLVPVRHAPHPSDAGEPDFINADYVSFVARGLEAVAARQVVEGPETRALVLFPSYRLMERVLAEVSDALVARIVRTERGRPLQSVIDRFAQTRHGIWFGVEWEGENFVDPLLRRTLVDFLVIPRLPQPPSDDVRINRLTEFFGGSAAHARRAEWVALKEALQQAYRRLDQGIARGIRNESDVIKLLAFLDIRMPVPPEVVNTRKVAKSGGDPNNIFAHFEQLLEPYAVKHWSYLEEDGTIIQML